MQKHPFTETRARTIFIATYTGIAIVLQSVLLYLYSDMSYAYALLDSVFTIGILTLFGYVFWFVIDVIRIVLVKIILSVVILLVWIGLCLVIHSMEYPTEAFTMQSFTIIPLRSFIGVVYWIILLQWYQIIKLCRWRAERIINDVVQAPLPETTIDRIAVKNGTRIHVIPIKELSHVQACGDYIMLYTPSGEFLKEQTMKSLESNLPSTFVRIHRSFIVNIEQIERVELFGKETYHVHLKNGKSIRASISGYKLLKEVLAM